MAWTPNVNAPTDPRRALPWQVQPSTPDQRQNTPSFQSRERWPTKAPKIPFQFFGGNTFNTRSNWSLNHRAQSEQQPQPPRRPSPDPPFRAPTAPRQVGSPGHYDQPIAQSGRQRRSQIYTGLNLGGYTVGASFDQKQPPTGPGRRSQSTGATRGLSKQDNWLHHYHKYPEVPLQEYFDPDTPWSSGYAKRVLISNADRRRQREFGLSDLAVADDVLMIDANSVDIQTHTNTQQVGSFGKPPRSFVSPFGQVPGVTHQSPGIFGRLLREFAQPSGAFGQPSELSFHRTRTYGQPSEAQSPTRNFTASSNLTGPQTLFPIIPRTAS
jgi:hypothetical protein